MSIIGNISILQNQQAKKAFSKISFEAGEKFDARIVSVDQQKGEVNLKLLDGWQFSAKIDKPLERSIDGSVVKFEVEGFEEGKLKIKLSYGDKEGIIQGNDAIDDSPYGKPLSDDDADALLFEKMIKHDMPLTKGNIIDIKNLVDFREKIFLNPEKEDMFIVKYLNSRNIDINSGKASEITNNLKNSFVAVKNLDVDEILLFKENNIELTKGNLESFTKLFKGESAIYNDLKDINNYLLNTSTTKNRLSNIELSTVSQNGTSFLETDESNIPTELKDPQLKSDFQEKDFTNLKINNEIKAGKLLNTNVPSVDKIRNSDKPIDNNIKEVVNLINKELMNLEINHRILNSTIKNLESDQNLNSVKNLEADKNFKLNPNLNSDPNLKSDQNFKVDKNLKLENVSFNSVSIKTLVDKIFKIQQISLNPDSYIKLIENLEEKLNLTKIEPRNDDLQEIKQNEEPLLNKLQSNTVNEVEQSSKSVINTKALGYGKSNTLNEIINMIKKELNFSEVDKAIINNVKNNIENITTDSLIKEQIKLKTEEIKNIVKLIIENKLNLKPEAYEKVMEVFDQKLNDIKVFNSISEQYYYLDLPINVKEDKYQLKLIIKDDRKKGKKIDSKNVQIATSVKTINMGTVDAYIKINNNNMNIDISCNKFFVKVLDLSKENLIKELSSMNYRVSIKVNNKTNEFTLANCGEFFDDRSFNTINIKV